MDFKATIDLIIRELEETCGILDDIARSSEPPLLEIELAKSKCRNAAGVIALLKNIPVEKKATATETLNKADDQPTIQTETPEVKHEAVQSSPTEEVTKNPVINAQDEKSLTLTPHPNAGDNITDPERKPFVAPIIADSFSHLAGFNEQLGETNYSRNTPISNLKGAIGLNDRFYYIREIFRGNRDEYDKAISRLENAIDFNDAKQILTGMGSGNDEAVKHLTDLVKRKFSK